MKNTKVNHLLEYLSPTLILSYFFIHKIFLVIIGMSFSFYLINITFINSILRSINKKIINKSLSSELNKNEKETKSESSQMKLSNEDLNFSLVETIEELGIIPSIDKDKDRNAV
tara:strand:- start:472 stop:813 length:342 start_codon:yes stop_codon:yes gene_type:complete